jgi:cysteine desulfurase
VFEAYAEKGNHIITVATEHKAVLDTCKSLERRGAEVTYLSVNKSGSLDLEELKNAVKPATILISVMYANNETGVMQPIRQIGEIAKEKNVLFFCDATQAVGKIPINVIAENIDLLCVSGHKMYAPKGVGALYVRRKNPRVALAEQINGGGHERGWRSGTLNVPSIVGLGKALDVFNEGENNKIKYLRNKLENALLQMEGTFLNGDKEKRIFNTCNISFGGVNGKMLIADLTKEIAVSSGSACSAASAAPSHVLSAMRVSEDLNRSAIRFSLGRFTTETEIDFTIQWVKKNLQREKLVL